MVKYAFKSDNLLVGKSRRDGVKASFKNTYSTCRAIKGMGVKRAFAYLDNVLNHKEIVPFFKFYKGVGRHSQARGSGTDKGRWPEKSVVVVKDILKQAVSNAKHAHKKEEDELYVISYCVNRARGRRRRTFRAHGRISEYESQPCHVELIVGPKPLDVEKAKALQ